MPKSRNRSPIVLPDDTDSLVIHFFISDGAPRVIVEFPQQGISFNHPISDYGSLTANQKNNLRAMLQALRDETFTLEGYV